MESTILLAALSAAEAAKNAATHATPPGLKVALAHVPSASEAMEVLKQHLADYAQAAAATATTANKAVPPGLKVALAHVPSGSEAMEVLKQHLAAYAQAVTEAIRHGLHLGLGK